MLCPSAIASRAAPPQLLDGFPEPLPAVLHLEEDRERDRPEAARAGATGERADLLELDVQEDGRRQLEVERGLGRRLEEVPLRADRRVDRHDDRLAVRVDRRVRHLGEELLEVVGEELRRLRQDGERDVRPHRPDRLRPRGGHRVDDHPHVLERVAERLLARQDGLVVGLADAGRVGQVLQADEVLLEPLPVRGGRGERLLDLAIGDDPSLRGVDEEDLAGLEAPLRRDLLRREVEDAHLGGHHDEAVLRRDPSRGPQAVAVEDRADPRAVGEGDGGRAVPRLEEAGVELVERLQLGAHRLVPAPRLRHHHHQRVRERAAGEDEQLEDVVEHRRVGAVGVDHGEDLLQVVAEELRLEHPLPRLHPVHVPAQRVDLAVVRDVAIRDASATSWGTCSSRSASGPSRGRT